VKKISRVLGDSASDSRGNFNFAVGIGPESVIRLSMNSTGRSSGSYARAQVVRGFSSDPRVWRRNMDTH